MTAENKDFIISEFEKMRKEIINSNIPKDDIKIIGSIAQKLNIEFAEVLNVIENRNSNGIDLHLQSLLNPFSKK